MDIGVKLHSGWQAVRIIGRGSFGTVYEIQRDIGGAAERAALKIISVPKDPDEINQLKNSGYDEESMRACFDESRQAVEREYSNMARLKGHSNIVYCDDFRSVRQDDGLGWDIFIKMELLSPLKEKLGLSLSEAEVIRLGRDMCNALIACSRLNIVHRDIKPENIFLSQDGRFKLGDFGIARSMEGTASGTVTGTFSYMAPEIYYHRPYNATVDIYSLGIVMYQLLNEGRIPFLETNTPTPRMKEEANNRRFSGMEIPAPAGGSRELKRIVLKACSYEPEKRYQRPEEMLRALDALTGGGQTVSPTPVPEGPKNDKAAQGGGRTFPKVIVNKGGDAAGQKFQEDTEGTVSAFSQTDLSRGGAERKSAQGGGRTFPKVIVNKGGDAAGQKFQEDTEGTVGAFRAQKFNNPPAADSEPALKKYMLLILAAAAVIFLLIVILIRGSGSDSGSAYSPGAGSGGSSAADSAAGSGAVIDYQEIYMNYIKDIHADYSYLNRYTLYDIDRNGIPELFVATYESALNNFVSVYTIDSDSQVMEYIDRMPYGDLAPYGSDEGVILSYYNQGEYRVYVYTLNGKYLRGDTYINGTVSWDAYDVFNIKVGEGVPIIPFTYLQSYHHDELISAGRFSEYSGSNNNPELLEKYAYLYN